MGYEFMFELQVDVFGKGVVFFGVELVGDCCVVSLGMLEGFEGEMVVDFFWYDVVVFLQGDEDLRIVFGVDDDYDVVEVFGCCVQYVGFVDVDYFDVFGWCCVGVGDCFFEWIEIDDDEVDGVDVVFIQFGEM